MRAATSKAKTPRTRRTRRSRSRPSPSPAVLPAPPATIKYDRVRLQGPGHDQSRRGRPLRKRRFPRAHGHRLPDEEQEGGLKGRQGDFKPGKEKALVKLVAGEPFGFFGPLSPGGFQQETITAKPGWYVAGLLHGHPGRRASTRAWAWSGCSNRQVDAALAPSRPVPSAGRRTGKRKVMGRPEGVRAGHAADQHAGAEMGAEHRPDLRAEQRLGAEQLACPAATRRSASRGRLRVLDDPVGRAAVVQLAQVVDHPLEARGGACARGRPGAISVPNVRIGLIFSAVPTIACAAPMRPPRRRYSSVSRQNQMSSVSRGALHGADDDLGGAEPFSRQLGRDQHQAASPPAPVWRRAPHRPGSTSSSASIRAASRALSTRAREPAGDVDREHVAAGRARAGCSTSRKSPDRRLRGRRQQRRLAQPRIEGVEVRVARARGAGRRPSPRTGSPAGCPSASISSSGHVGACCR